MVKINLKGIAKVTAKGRTYWYAWRGGPRLRGEPGSAEFHASFIKAHEELRTPDASRFRALVIAYKVSDQYRDLAPATKENWGPWLDRIAEHFGELRIEQFDRPQKIRPVIVRWRGQWASKPRTADVALQVLSRVLAHGVDPLGKIAGNPCEGIRRLYDGGNRADIIWTRADIAALKHACSPEIAHAVDLAVHTGLRQGDLLRLRWPHIGDDAIRTTTGKSGHRREAIIPIYDQLRTLLAGIPKRAMTVLTNSLGRPWGGGFRGAFNEAKLKAGLGDRDLHFHDLRGTAATEFYMAGLDKRVIAEILAWEEERVSKIIRTYVDRSAATRATIMQLNKFFGGTK